MSLSGICTERPVLLNSSGLQKTVSVMGRIKSACLKIKQLRLEIAPESWQHKSCIHQC